MERLQQTCITRDIKVDISCEYTQYVLFAWFGLISAVIPYHLHSFFYHNKINLSFLQFCPTTETPNLQRYRAQQNDDQYPLQPVRTAKPSTIHGSPSRLVQPKETLNATARACTGLYSNSTPLSHSCRSSNTRPLSPKRDFSKISTSLDFERMGFRGEDPERY